MINRVENKWVLITGATAGIGKATARAFAKMNCNLVITGRRIERLESLQKDLKEQFNIQVEISAFDVRDADACKAAVRQLTQPVDILVNNAGLAKGFDPIDSGSLDDWNTMIDTNIKGLLFLTRLISAQMRDQNSGHIINIGSTAGHETYPNGAVYCATKYAVRAITEATKKDLHGTKVRVSCISPGLVETEFSEVRFDGDSERAKKVYQGMQALTAEDVADVILYTANSAPHVNILETVIMPVDQSSSQMVHRDENR